MCVFPVFRKCLSNYPLLNARLLQTTTNFGLINRTYDTDFEYDPEHIKTQWQRFQHQVFRYNRESGKNVQHKVLYLGRHGEGYHNVAESFYGTHDWDVCTSSVTPLRHIASKTCVGN